MQSTAAFIAYQVLIWQVLYTLKKTAYFMPKLTLQYIILHNEKLKCVTLLICQFNIFPTAKIAINRLIFKSITFILALKH